MSPVVQPTRPRDDRSDDVAALATYLARAVAEVPDRVAITGDDGTSVDYATLGQLAARAAQRLRHASTAPGDVVAIQAPNLIDTVAWMWGAWWCGAVVCPIVTIYREREVSFILSEARPAVVVAPAEYRGCRHVELVRASAQRAGVTPAVIELGSLRDDASATSANEPPVPPVEVDPDGAALLLYTSGTTADPKGVIHSATTLVREALSIAEIARFDAAGVSFMPSPLTHVTGLLYGVLMPVLTHGSCVLQARWEPESAAVLVDQHRCSLSVGATPFLRGMVDALRGKPGLRPVDVFICGGADIPAALIREAWDLGIRAVRTYGSSEMPTATIGDPYGEPGAAALDEGRPIGAAEVRVVAVDGEHLLDDPDDRPGGQVGELQVRGPELFLGYRDPALNGSAFTADGFFRTGDLARMTERGTIEICGRIKDLINRGGEKFSARDIEDALLEHPGIREVAVTGVPDPALVERACAFIVAEHGAEATLTVARLAAFLAARGYAIQKAPEHVRLVRELPRTASGKVRKFELKAAFSDSADPAELPLAANRSSSSAPVLNQQEPES